MKSNRRIIPLALICAVVLVAGIGTVVLVRQLTQAGSVGELSYELQGVVSQADYSTAKAVPASQRPSWLPTAASSIDVRSSGPNARQKGKVLLDATVPTGFRLPSTCSNGNTPFPWNDGWTAVDPRTASYCDGWGAEVEGDHLYTWR